MSNYIDYKAVNSLNLIDILITNGFKKSHEYTKNYPKYTDGTNTIVCFMSKKNMNWRWFYQYDSATTYSIADGINMGIFDVTMEKKFDLKNYEHKTEYKEPYKKIEDKEFDIKIYEKNLTKIKDYNYRGFSFTLKYLYTNKHNSVIFPNWALINDKWQIVGYTEKHQGGFNAVKGKRGLVLHVEGFCVNICFGENIIDLLALKSLYWDQKEFKDCMYVSFQGNITSKQLEDCATLYKGGNIYTAFDNDEAGLNYTKKIQAVFKHITTYTPTNKDFLEDFIKTRI